MAWRPRSHVIEDLAAAKISAELSKLGWVVEAIDKDYGEDFIVTIFENGAKTEKFFYVQSKATDTIENYIDVKSGCIMYPVVRDRLSYWTNCLAPVVLMVFDTSTENMYWSYIEKKQAIPDRKKIKIKTDMRNDFSKLGIKRLRDLIFRRFEELKSQEDGAEVVIDVLAKSLGLNITYEPQGGVLIIPRGTFKPDPEGEQMAVLFGPLGAQLEKASREIGMLPERYLLESLETYHRILESYRNGGALVFRDKDGKLIREFKTMSEFQRYAEEKRLLGEKTSEK